MKMAILIGIRLITGRKIPLLDNSVLHPGVFQIAICDVGMEDTRYIFYVYSIARLNGVIMKRHLIFSVANKCIV
ncbi:hypothetical protein ABW13_02800 [Pluralibacter gergoviae]|nr:hypothetical protein ABW13_02800 [Pluralibacter gergoviae]